MAISRVLRIVIHFTFDRKTIYDKIKSDFHLSDETISNNGLSYFLSENIEWSISNYFNIDFTGEVFDKVEVSGEDEVKIDFTTFKCTEIIWDNNKMFAFGNRVFSFNLSEYNHSFIETEY